MSLVYGLLRYVGILWAVSQINGPVSSQRFGNNSSLQQCRCAILTDICMVTGLAIVSLLQGMMALRVYILLEKSKYVLVILVVGFLITQSVTFSIVISESLVARSGSIVTPANEAISGITSCNKTSSEPKQWVWPLCCSALMVFELILIVLYLYSAVLQLKRPLWTSIRRSAGAIGMFIVKQSLIYFIIAFLVLLITAVGQSPTLQSLVSEPTMGSIKEYETAPKKGRFDPYRRSHVPLFQVPILFSHGGDNIGDTLRRYGGVAQDQRQTTARQNLKHKVLHSRERDNPGLGMRLGGRGVLALEREVL
ncbi:hypothetical protein CONPUDRAFT_77307 [Coniophora puteana RWD-64-598 SS2]|uniref:Uncharacterized protein n=1 Tax=Coniophora puteana (strain RWD-64-598) TaxID=741705 RepID=A0A5M3M9B5_CONPW|nr:uncharacterized protein CONPUDRAFT_77307 [Coniophora puteana RWD-64-598 SS2]EIW75677.1 hypothetical protein CONPUDRAFT_77307 [Coniophora puteana RWD-64-598 SS2]